jgi:hypothetical protein
MYLKIILITLIITCSSSISLSGLNILNSISPLFNSNSKIDNLDLSKFDIIVTMPEDKRAHFYGEIVYKKKKVNQSNDFFQNPTMIEIQNKIISDLRAFGLNNKTESTKDKMEINTIVEVFYTDLYGFAWIKSYAKVRLSITVNSNDGELLNKKYESFYISGGKDKEFEGRMATTMEQVVNVTIGMTLRMALDKFYFDLDEIIKNNY